MAVSKIHEFQEEDVLIATVAKALSHPARIEILRILAEKNTCMCGEIVEQLPLAQSTVSQHLKELKDAGLVKGEIDGPKVCYCIDNVMLRKVKNMFDKLFKHAYKCC